MKNIRNRRRRRWTGRGTEPKEYKQTQTDAANHKDYRLREQKKDKRDQLIRTGESSGDE